MKNGACGLTGAAVLQFPVKVQRQAKRRMNRVELDARHSWMMSNRSKWETEVTDGAEHMSARMAMLMKLMDEKLGPVGGQRMTVARMRRDITEGRKLIEKRNRVKRWLASLGVDLAEIEGPEQALFAAFDQLA